MGEGRRGCVVVFVECSIASAVLMGLEELCLCLAFSLRATVLEYQVHNFLTRVTTIHVIEAYAAPVFCVLT
jgi:hypothetical protein